VCRADNLTTFIYRLSPNLGACCTLGDKHTNYYSLLLTDLAIYLLHVLALLHVIFKEYQQIKESDEREKVTRIGLILITCNK